MKSRLLLYNKSRLVYKNGHINEARFMLIGTELPVTQVGQACGFENPSAFARAYKAHFGFSPSQRRTPYMGLLPTPFWSDWA